MEIKLSENSIKEAITNLKTFKRDIQDASQSIVQRLLDEGKAQATVLDSVAYHSGTEPNEVLTAYKRKNNSGEIILRGPNAVYDEFGTGEEGKANSHPLHDTVSPKLNPYNSGPYISTHIDANNKHYYYYPPMAGQPYFESGTGKSHGIPAGLQMYNTAKFLRSEKNNVIKEELNAVIKKINSL